MKITFPSGLYYVPKQSAIAETLFTSGGTASGYYKRYKRRVQFFSPQGVPVFALINNQSLRSGESPFFVSCSQDSLGRTVYFHGLSTLDAGRLGIPDNWKESSAFAEIVWNSLNTPTK